MGEEESCEYIPLADGSCIFAIVPENLIVTHIATATASRDLARFCLSSHHAKRFEPLFAQTLAAEQHGISKEDCGEGQYLSLSSVCRSLESVQDRASFEFTRPFMAVLLKGERREGDRRRAPEFMLVDVGGGRTGFRTVAACPPGLGDSWRLLVPLRRGHYKLEVSGWRNPHHGILDISLDNKAISPVDGLDWYADASTSPYNFPPMIFEVQTTGTHVLRGEVNRCHANALGAKYWICLDHLRILPFDEVAVPEPAPRVPARSAGNIGRERAFRRRPVLKLAARAAAVLAREGRKLVSLPLHLTCPCRRSRHRSLA